MTKPSVRTETPPGQADDFGLIKQWGTDKDGLRITDTGIDSDPVLWLVRAGKPHPVGHVLLDEKGLGREVVWLGYALDEPESWRVDWEPKILAEIKSWRYSLGGS